jgi:putative transposase
MDDDHLWTALRYVERNPVRAGIVRDAADFPWSSARLHLGGGWDGLVDLAPFSERWTVDEWRDFLTVTEFERESDALRRSTHSGRPLGSSRFVSRLEESLARPLLPRRGGRPKKKSASREIAQRLLAAM